MYISLYQLGCIKKFGYEVEVFYPTIPENGLESKGWSVSQIFVATTEYLRKTA